MKTLKNYGHMLLIILVFGLGCKENTVNLDTTPPAPVSDPFVKNLAGGALISYTLPDDKNLLYVKAVYERNGQTLEAKGSFYTPYLKVEGYGDTEEHIVKLYSVTRAGVESTPVEVTIQPLKPAIATVLETLKVNASFGGMILNFINPANEDFTTNNIVIGVLRWSTEDERLPEWVSVENFYTSLTAGKFAVRRQQPVLTKFGIFLRDRWGNLSDTMEVELTPWPEVMLDKKKIAYLRGKPVPQTPPLPASGLGLKDPTGNLSSWPFANMFDDQYGNQGFHTNERQDIPIWVCMDLGVSAKLSRYKFWQRNSGNDCGFCFSHGNCHSWEVWGTNNVDDVNSWVLLDKQTMIKPSGMPVGVNTNEDKAAADAGHEFDFPLDAPPVRYIGWKHIDNWGALEGTKGFMHIAEMEFWGEIK